MSTLQQDAPRVVLYEGPGAAPLSDERRYELVRSLLEAGYGLARPADGGSVAPADAAPLVVLGAFEAGREPVFDGVDGGRLRVHDIAEQETQVIVDRVAGLREQSGAPEPGQWTPWFPVIDYERCTNCMQCLSFCLFDVYGVDGGGVDGGGQIEVRNQDNCKTNCPACSRVCPEVAILFPKYKKGPINGDVVRAEDVRDESMKVDISALLGGDIYASLRERSSEARQRFSTERDESRALLERKRCLKELKQTLDIPDEVLMTLPSAGEIEERARRAKEKLAKRRARSKTVSDQRRQPTEDEWGI